MKKKVVIKTVVIVLTVLVIAAVIFNFYSSSKPKTAECAAEGQAYSLVYKNQYPEKCCGGLTGWSSGMDTRISIAGNCYDTGMVSGNPVGTCIKCGDGICGAGEGVCNCHADCKGIDNSDYKTIEDFCQQRWNNNFKQACTETSLAVMAICGLCK